MLVGTKPREMSGKVYKSDPDRAFGRESRSLKACYELYEVRMFGMTCMYSMQEESRNRQEKKKHEARLCGMRCL